MCVCVSVSVCGTMWCVCGVCVSHWFGRDGGGWRGRSAENGRKLLPMEARQPSNALQERREQNVNVTGHASHSIGISCCAKPFQLKLIQYK